LPKYVQLSERLIREIAAGHLVDGARLPPEREMAQGLGVAIGTLRKALAELAAKGLLERIQGSGNYVRHQPEVQSVYAMFRLELARGGGLPTADVLSVERLAKPGEAPEFGASAEAHRIRRLRRLDGEPVAVEEIWLDGGQAARITRGDLSESLYLFYRERLNLVIAMAEDRVGVAEVPDWAPGAFAPVPGARVGHIERLSRTSDGRAVEYSRTWFDSDKARYVQRMGKG
jgi:GntR family transcriptional regulator